MASYVLEREVPDNKNKMNCGRGGTKIFKSRCHRRKYVSHLHIFKSHNTLQIRAASDLAPSMTELLKNTQLKSHSDLYHYSLQSSDAFWETLARSSLRWISDFSKVSECDLGKGHVKWFLDGKLNVSGCFLHQYKGEE